VSHNTKYTHSTRGKQQDELTSRWSRTGTTVRLHPGEFVLAPRSAGGSARRSGQQAGGKSSRQAGAADPLDAGLSIRGFSATSRWGVNVSNLPITLGGPENRPALTVPAGEPGGAPVRPRSRRVPATRGSAGRRRRRAYLNFHGSPPGASYRRVGAERAESRGLVVQVVRGTGPGRSRRAAGTPRSFGGRSYAGDSSVGHKGVVEVEAQHSAPGRCRVASGAGRRAPPPRARPAVSRISRPSPHRPPADEQANGWCGRGVSGDDQQRTDRREQPHPTPRTGELVRPSPPNARSRPINAAFLQQHVCRRIVDIPQ